MSTALRLEKKWHAENWLTKTLLNLQYPKKQSKDKASRYVCPMVGLGLLCICLFTDFTTIPPLSYECTTIVDL